LNFTVYVFGVHAPVNVTFPVIGVPKSNDSQFNVHSENLYPVFVGFSGLVAFFSYLTFCPEIALHPLVSKVTG
jgi:hypothetical protein